MIEQQPLTPRQMSQLMANLNPNRVATRQKLSYLEAYDVKATLIRVFGFGNFSADLIESEIVDMREVPQAKNQNVMNWKVSAKAVVRLHIHQTGATYTEAAIAGSSQPDITESMDMALKSAESDALKRAAIYLGTQFGLSLYNEGSKQDVVKVVLAPGQEWPEPAREQVQAEIERLQQIIHGEIPSQDAAKPTAASTAPEGVLENGVTPHQRKENEALFNRAVSMKKQKQAEATDKAIVEETEAAAEAEARAEAALEGMDQAPMDVKE